MRIDVATIFPEYLASLDLSLVGKARRQGLLALEVHDLRSWTTDRHRTVDDTPVGGGAGMVMRPDVWGTALDAVLAAPMPPEAREPRRVLMIPTPSGDRLTQRDLEDLAGADQIVLACGRYEGIDGRVVEHYRSVASDPAAGLEVREFSLGDYVLNGGEVAALVVVEGVARLLPGVVGNPHSLVEESHGAAGLLEYPVFTRPPSWRGLDVPPVLLGGDHTKVARWRRDRALERTARRRPDMIEVLDPDSLDRDDRRTLLREGWLCAEGAAPRRVVLERPRPGDAPALYELAAQTFPDACPPGMAREDIDGFVEANLSIARFEEYLAAPQRHHLLVARTADGRLDGYTMSVLPRTPDEGPYAADVAALTDLRPLVEVSKLYVRAGARGTGLAGELLERAVAETLAPGGCPALGPDARAAGVWVGTNGRNRRAQRLYRAHGFELAGPREFTVGSQVHQDVVFVRPA